MVVSASQYLTEELSRNKEHGRKSKNSMIFNFVLSLWLLLVNFFVYCSVCKCSNSILIDLWIVVQTLILRQRAIHKSELCMA